MNDKHLDDIKAFIEEVRWKYPFELTENTKLEYDLKITGDDAVDFITAFAQRFNVDISHFIIEQYFEPEGMNMVSGFMNWLFQKNQYDRKILKISDLEKAIELKELI